MHGKVKIFRLVKSDGSAMALYVARSSTPTTADLILLHRVKQDYVCNSRVLCSSKHCTLYPLMATGNVSKLGSPTCTTHCAMYEEVEVIDPAKVDTTTTIQRVFHDVKTTV